MTDRTSPDIAVAGQGRRARPGAATRRYPEPGDRWENGSDFHLALEGGRATYPWSDRRHAYFGTGRDALRATIALGRARWGWRRLLVPSYYCHDILPSLRRELPVALYPCSPIRGAASVEAREGDVVLVASILGLPMRPDVPPGTAVIEDHTHDPLSDWAWTTKAAYAVASLRKTLPLPDGGVCWSPCGLALPSEPALTPAHAAAALDRLSAMALKLHYLAGAPVAKEDFRKPAFAGERALGRGEPSAMSPYSRGRAGAFPALEWRVAKERNRETLATALRGVPGVEVLDTPFAVTLVFEAAAARDVVRRRLIDARVYCAVLWPLDPTLEDVPAEDVDLSTRVLSVHCDFRYGTADMERVAAAVRRAARRVT